MSPRTFLLFALLGGCKGCGDKPYVPYSIDPTATQSPAPDASAAALPDAGAPSAFGEKGAETAPPNVARWTIDGLELTAPAGRVFVMGLVRDFDGDGTKEALAIVRTQDKTNEAGQLLFYKGGNPVAVQSPEIPTEASCTGTSRLGMVGSRTAVAELGVACVARAVSGPNRWFAVLRVDKALKVQIAAEVTDPPAAPKLTLEADGADIDGDQIDDVTLRVSVEGGGAPFEPGPKMSATLRWHDRPVGLSRDPATPESSFATLASQAMARSVRVKEAPGVPNQVAQIRALYRALCPEAGSPRIVRTGGGAAACGHSRALEDAGLAEARAYVTMNDPLRAIASLERAQRPPATRTASRTTEAQGWIATIAPTVQGKTRILGTVPAIDAARAPQWGPLAFQADGKLLIKTADKVVRVDPESAEEADSDVPLWKTQVISPDGAMRWIEAYNACDGVALRATFQPLKEGEMKDVALPVPSPFGLKCKDARGERATVIPIAWGPRGIEAVVAGEPLLIAPDLSKATPLAALLDQPYQMGSPRSPNGKVLAVATSLGILVRGPKSALVRSPDLDNAGQCAPADDGARVACVKGARAIYASF